MGWKHRHTIHALTSYHAILPTHLTQSARRVRRATCCERSQLDQRRHVVRRSWACDSRFQRPSRASVLSHPPFPRARCDTTSRGCNRAALRSVALDQLCVWSVAPVVRQVAQRHPLPRPTLVHRVVDRASRHDNVSTREPWELEARAPSHSRGASRHVADGTTSALQRRFGIC
jgi:hypothetical protein